jgi:hypothetical protein
MSDHTNLVFGRSLRIPFMFSLIRLRISPNFERKMSLVPTWRMTVVEYGWPRRLLFSLFVKPAILAPRTPVQTTVPPPLNWVFLSPAWNAILSPTIHVVIRPANTIINRKQAMGNIMWTCLPINWHYFSVNFYYFFPNNPICGSKLIIHDSHWHSHIFYLLLYKGNKAVRSYIYNLYAADFHLPMFIMHSSDNPQIAAEVAAPILKLCDEKCSRVKPMVFNPNFRVCPNW